MIESLTLDGVMQAPGRPDEDTRGGFEHGGWAIPYADEVMGRAMGARMRGPRVARSCSAGGRTRTSSMSGRTGRTTPTPRRSTRRRSTSPRDPDGAAALAELAVLEGDGVDGVATLKDEPGKDIGILGSGQLVRSLIGRGLIDEFVLLIHPLVLGSGTRLFPEDAHGSARADRQPDHDERRRDCHLQPAPLMAEPICSSTASCSGSSRAGTTTDCGSRTGAPRTDRRRSRRQPGGHARGARRFPSALDWLPDGRLLLVSARDGLLLAPRARRRRW